MLNFSNPIHPVQIIEWQLTFFELLWNGKRITHIHLPRKEKLFYNQGKKKNNVMYLRLLTSKTYISTSQTLPPKQTN